MLIKKQCILLLLVLLSFTSLTLLQPNMLFAEGRTYHKMTTGNGHGFQIFDREDNKITFFFDLMIKNIFALSF